MLLSLKSCHWPQSYQAVTSRRNLGRVIIPRGGPVRMSLKSVNLLLSTSTFLFISFTSSKTCSSFYKFSSVFTPLVDERPPLLGSIEASHSLPYGTVLPIDAYEDNFGL